MGNEFGQLREWDEKREQDWMLLDYPIHSGFARFMKDLNEIYLTHSALWEKDYQADGFRWIDCHQEQTCVYVLERSSKKEHLTAVFNFSDRSQTYELKLPGCQKIKELLNSDLEAYGGSLKRRRPARKITDGRYQAELPAFSAMYYICLLYTSTGGYCMMNPQGCLNFQKVFPDRPGCVSVFIKIPGNSRNRRNSRRPSCRRNGR